MKTTAIQFNFDTTKLEALNIYMKDKEGTLQSELESYMDQIYKKYVPSPVREFIEKKEDSPTQIKTRRGKRHSKSGENTTSWLKEETAPPKDKTATQTVSEPENARIWEIKV